LLQVLACPYGYGCVLVLHALLELLMRLGS
jgi:hypothetical protein